MDSFSGADLYAVVPAYLKGLGVSPLHFGVLLTVGTMLGMMTPPVELTCLSRRESAEQRYQR